MNNYAEPIKGRIIFGCCSAHCCDVCYANLGQFNIPRCYMCRSRETRQQILYVLAKDYVAP